MREHSVYIGLGSNLGDRVAHLREAVHRLGAIITIERVSQLYVAAPLGYVRDDAYINAALHGATTMTPIDLLGMLQQIEVAMGRRPGVQFGPRPIDLDLLFFDSIQMETYKLTIPHPRLAERAFVLKPLADIAPDFMHPVLYYTMSQLLADAGYTQVASTMDPKEVCALHRRHRYDLILLDLQMPGMDGFQVMEGLKTNDSDGYLPVIVLTAQPGHKLRALQAGAKDFISKPFDLVEVKTRIHNMLEVRLLYKKLENYSKELEQTVQERTAELRESEARFKSLAELASDWYWEQDDAGNFTKISGPVLEMLGMRVDTLAGGAPGTQVAGWNEAERADLQARIANRQPFLDFLFNRVNPDGSQQQFRISGEPMFNQSSRFIGYRGIGVEVLAPN